MINNHEKCLALLEQIRWGEQPKCPYCQSNNATVYKNEHRYHCNTCYNSYSVTVGTFLHKTHVDLDKWFVGIRLVLNSPRGISARHLAREIGVNKNTACYMMQRIQKAMVEEKELLELLNKAY